MFSKASYCIYFIAYALTILSFLSTLNIRALLDDFLYFVPCNFVFAIVTDHHIEVAVMEAGQDTSVASVVLWQIRGQA